MRTHLATACLAAVAFMAACSSPTIEKTPPVIVVDEDAGAQNVAVDCGEGRSYCADECIDTSLDSQNCGDCGIECPTQTVCSVSTCEPVPADCRADAVECPTSYYCFEETGFCVLGCDSNVDCPTGSFCQIESHTCLCQADAEVVCGSQCIAEGPTACGADCRTCPTQSNATAACADGACEITCDTGTVMCDGTCAECPVEAGIAGTGCQGTSCVATQCADGYELCNGVCAGCPNGGPGESYGCDGTQCVITDCPTGTRLCDGECAVCPDATAGTLQCAGTQCTLACNTGTNLCAGACVPDDDLTACGPACVACAADPNGAAVCEQGACGLNCDTNFRECGAVCAACPTVGVATTRCAGAVCTVATCQAGSYACALGCCQDPTDGTVKVLGNPNPSSIDIALDSNGFPVGVYAANGEAGYFYWDGQQWVVEPLPNAIFAAMDLDANGVAHVAISESTKARYGNRASGTFAGASFVDISNVSIATAADIAIDGSGNAHMIFEDTSDRLRHATSADAWMVRTVDAAETGPQPSLIWHGSRLHVVYADGNPNNADRLFYRWYDAANGWSSREIANTGFETASQTTSLAFTSGDAWAVWSGTFAGAARGPGAWSDAGFATPTTAIDPKVAIDNAGMPHIFYTFQDVREVAWNGSQWSAPTTIVPGDLPAGVFDSGGVLHLFYFAGAELKYVRR